MTEHDDIERMAAHWVARRDGGALSAEDEAAFSTWLNARTAHRVSYLRLNATWERTQRLAALEHRNDVAASPAAKSRPGASARWLAFAASLLLACAAGWYGWRYSQSLYSTEIGALQSVALADGSRVTLNTQSAMRVDVTGRRREVELREGEAFFEVAHDAAHPFAVRSGDVAVEVVGTQFSVHRMPGAVHVVVSEGHVRVRSFDGAGRAAHPTDLLAGDVAVLSNTGIERRHLSADEIDAALSWRHGQLVFRDTPLMQAVAEFNRYSTRQVIIVDPQLAGRRIGGTFRTGNIDVFLRLLQQAFDVQVTAQDGAILLSER